MGKLSAIQDGLKDSEVGIERTGRWVVRNEYHLTHDQEGLRLTIVSDFYDANEWYSWFKALFGTSSNRTTRQEYKIRDDGGGTYEGIYRKDKEEEESVTANPCYVSGMAFIAGFSNSVRDMMNAGESESITMPVIEFIDSLADDVSQCKALQNPPSPPIKIRPFETAT